VRSECATSLARRLVTGDFRQHRLATSVFPWHRWWTIAGMQSIRLVVAIEDDLASRQPGISMSSRNLRCGEGPASAANSYGSGPTARLAAKRSRGER
jgi:hypothetical protein